MPLLMYLHLNLNYAHNGNCGSTSPGLRTHTHKYYVAYVNADVDLTDRGLDWEEKESNRE